MKINEKHELKVVCATLNEKREIENVCDSLDDALKETSIENIKLLYMILDIETGLVPDCLEDLYDSADDAIVDFLNNY